MKKVTIIHRALFALCLISFCAVHAQSQVKDRIDRAQAGKYISHLVDSLFIPSNKSSQADYKIVSFCQKVTPVILSNKGAYAHFYSYAKEYTSQEIYNALLQEALAYIARKSMRYARRYTQQLFTTVVVNQHKVAALVSGKVTQEARDIIAKSNVLSQGALADFIGTALQNKVYNSVKQELRYYSSASSSSAPRPAAHVETKCPRCLKEYTLYIADHKRIDFSCGHSICANCLKKRAEIYKNDDLKCFLCNYKININNYKHLLP